MKDGLLAERFLHALVSELESYFGLDFIVFGDIISTFALFVSLTRRTLGFKQSTEPSISESFKRS